MTRPARAVFIGCGGRAGATFRDFQEAGGELVAMCDPSDDPYERFGAKPDVPLYKDLGEMLKSVDADAAFIASPNFAHAEQFIACCEAGLHTWVEKPIAITLDEAYAMRDAAEKAGVKAAIPFATNEDPHERDAVELVKRGDLGPLVQMTMVRTCGAGLHVSGGRHYAIDQPEVSGGWIAHHLCHMIDFAIQIGGPIDRVYCKTQTTYPNPKPHQEEAIATVMNFANGGTASLCDMQSRYQSTRTIINGHRGTWIGREDKTRVRQKASDIRYSVDTMIDGEHSLQRWTADEYLAYDASKPSYAKQFLDAIMNGGPWHTTIDRGINVMKVYLAAQQSAASGEPVAIA